MAKVLEFKAKNVRPFTSWLKRFSSIDNSLLLEIDNNIQYFIAKTHNPVKSIIKYSKISFEEAGLELIGKLSIDKRRIKVGIYHLPRLIKSIDNFISGEFIIGFKYEEIIEENELAGTDIQLKNSSLKINITTASIRIFKYLSDEKFNKISKVNTLITFELASFQIEKINSLCALDNEYLLIDFKTIKQNLTVRGKTFELILAESKTPEAKISIYKSQFDKLDIENYEVNLSLDRLIFKSKDSDIITVISMVEIDEKYEESPIDFF